MAKVKIEGLDEAIDEIFKDYKRAANSAAEEATEKAKNDLYSNAVSCLVAYYDDYDPNIYDRTYSLIDSFVPYKDIEEEYDGFLCIAGVEFDSNRIANTYSGSNQYTPTDADWVISNFLSGIHPRTDGSQVIGGGNYENMAYYGSFVPSEEMQRYINRYYYIFNDNFRKEISKQIMRKVRR